MKFLHRKCKCSKKFSNELMGLIRDKIDSSKQKERQIRCKEVLQTVVEVPSINSLSNSRLKFFKAKIKGSLFRIYQWQV